MILKSPNYIVAYEDGKVWTANTTNMDPVVFSPEVAETIAREAILVFTGEKNLRYEERFDGLFVQAFRARYSHPKHLTPQLRFTGERVRLSAVREDALFVALSLAYLARTASLRRNHETRRR